MSLTGASKQTAAQYLGTHVSLERAVDSYLDNRDPSADLVDIYTRYQSPDDPDTIDIEGTMRYLGDLGIEPEDVRSLALAYLLKAPSVGCFRKDDFLSVWTRKNVSSVADMRRCLDSFWEEVVASPQAFRALYEYTFGFLLEKPNKLLDRDLVVEYWKLLLGYRYASHPKREGIFKRLDQWYVFVGEYKRDFSRDMWNMFYLFVEEVVGGDPEGLGGYDEMAAWPSVVDEFIEYLHDNP